MVIASLDIKPDSLSPNTSFEDNKIAMNWSRTKQPSKRVRKEHASYSQVDVSSVMHLVDFHTVSWIWDSSIKDLIDKDYHDYIGQLPDDIIVNVLSRLTMKEAMRTSVLSSRWRYLWTFLTGILDFDASRTVQAMKYDYVKKSLPDERRKFVNCVNKVLNLHQGPRVDGLKICFDVDNAAYNHHIDNWINFAIQKRVKRLHLDLTSSLQDHNPGDYNFPSQLLGSSSFKSLTALHLKFVNVTGEVIEYFLSNCPLLELLSVRCFSRLGNLKVLGPSLKLKYLELMNNHVESVEISARNLVAFKYSGGYISDPFKDVPRLAEVSFGRCYSQKLIEHKFCDLSPRYLSQLVTLKLEACLRIYGYFPDFPKFNNLKHLQLTIHVYDDNSVLHYTSLIQACPRLHRLSIKLNWSSSEVGRSANWEVNESGHQCLKVVEIAGFRGVSYDVALFTYLAEYAVLLEKVIVDPHDVFKVENGLCCYGKKEELKAARLRARELKAKLPPRAKLMIS